jgi:hypothetical protein
MPMGSKHLLSGIVQQSRYSLVLHPDEGGEWELEAGFIMHFRLRAMIGKHILIEGVRISFNALAVERFWRL